MKIDYDTLKNADINNIIKLRNLLDTWHDCWKDSNFIEVTILNRDGNITQRIKEKFPSFKVRWNPSQNGCGIGENIVIIHKSDWNETTKAEISKFDDFVGHHIKKHLEYEVKTDVKLPFDLKCMVNHRKHILKDKNANVRFTRWEIDKLSLWRDKDKYFNEVEVSREWEDKLWVRDFTNDTIFDMFKDVSVDL